MAPGSPHLVDLTTFYPPHVGGVEAYASAFHRELLDSDPGARVTVVCAALGPGASVGVERIDERLTVSRYRAFEPVTSFGVPSLRAIDRALRATGVAAADVVVSHTRFYPASWAARRIAKRLGARWVHVEHGATFVQAGGAGVRAVARSVDSTLGRRVLRRADDVVAVSAAAAAFTRELAGREAIVARRGISVPNAPWEAAASRGHVTFVGRLVDAKGVRVLVDAFAQLPSERELHLVGDGPDRALLEQRATQLGIRDRVVFHGDVPAGDVASHVRDARVFVNPSFTEGLPTTVLEAAAIGVPIVATNVGGTSEILDDGRLGRLVEPRDAAQLAAAIAAALEPGDADSALVETRRAHVRTTFGWNAMLAVVSPAAAPAPS